MQNELKVKIQRGMKNDELFYNINISGTADFTELEKFFSGFRKFIHKEKNYVIPIMRDSQKQLINFL